jgi:uncharacterized FlaG/YvyC family protein
MDIRNVVRNVLPLLRLDPVRARAKRDVSAETQDRDADGKRGENGEGKRRHLTLPELDDVLAYLKRLQGVEKNGLEVSLDESSGTKVVYIKDHEGRTVRRLTEEHLIQILEQKAQTSGHLLNKAL